MRNNQVVNFNIGMSALVGLDDFVIVGDEIWFFHILYNALFKIDMCTGKITYIAELENEDNVSLLSTTMFLWEEKLYLIPGYAKNIYIYDLKKGVIKKVNLHEKISGSRKFHAYLENDQMFLALPHDSRSFLIFDKKEKKFTSDERWYKEYLKNERDIGGLIFEGNNVLENNYLYLGLVNSNKVMKYNLISGQCDFMEMLDKDDRIVSLCAGKERKWLISSKGMVIELNEADEIVQKGSIDFESEEIGYFSHYYQQKETIIILTMYCMLVYSVNDKSVKQINYPNNGTFRSLCKYTEDKVYFDLLHMESIWFFNIKDFSFGEMKLWAEEETKYKIISRCVLLENNGSNFNLNTFLKMIRMEKKEWEH